MLDPFIELLGHCLKYKYEGFVSHSVKSTTFLLRLPLPSIDIHSNNIGDCFQNDKENLLLHFCLRDNIRLLL